MILFEKLFHSSIGRKLLIALTGLAMAFFLIAHMFGNLLIFAGPDALNQYAAGMRQLGKFGDFPTALWVARLGLLTVFIMHTVLAIWQTYENRRARPHAYEYANSVAATLPSRMMILSGLLVFSFVVYHLLHFTAGEIQSQYFNIHDHLGRHNAYEMLVRSFRHETPVFGVRLPLVASSYIFALVVLGLHLHHGIGSLLQTLGVVRGVQSYSLLRKISILYVSIVISGFMAVPVAIYTGLIKLPGE